MISLIKKLFGKGETTDFKALINTGAQIIDVRTAREYSRGRLQSSVNIPLDTLESNLIKITKERPVITCCASGIRSTAARNLLLSNGYTQVYNGGSWMNLKKYEQ